MTQNTPTFFKLDLPLYTGGKTKVLKSGKETKPTKKYWLTLNNYRNWHFQVANGTKINFKKDIEDQIDPLPDLSLLWGRIHLRYTLFPPNRAKRDLTNSVSVIDKYFADALVELGKLKEDTCEYIPEVSCIFGGVDKHNPRMEVVIRPFLGQAPI